MNGVITLGGKEIGVTANAATPIFYSQLFHDDFINETNETRKKDQYNVESFGKLAFIMNCQAKAENRKQLQEMLTFDNYMEFLEGIDDPMAIPNAAAAIYEFYSNQKVTLSKPKKKHGRRNGRSQQGYLP